MKGLLFGSMVTFALWLSLLLHLPSSVAGDIRFLSIDKKPPIAVNKENNRQVKILTKRNILDQDGASTPYDHHVLNPAEHQVSNDRTTSNVSHTTLSNLENDRVTHLLQLRYRERKKQERLMAIQSHILQSLRIRRKPNISSNIFSEEEQRKMNDMVQKVHHINNNDINNNGHEKTHDNGHHQIVRPSRHRPVNANNSESRIFRPQTTMQWLQSFYPSCVLQNQTDRGVWEYPGTFRINYDLPLKRYSQGSKVTVLLANLRLYKTINSWDNEMDDDSEISVSIYQLLRPLRVNKRERKRLINTQLLPMDKEGWVEFDVAATLNFWLHHTHRNYGFDVQVEDSQGNNMDPHLFFQSMNCTFGENETQESPFPNIRGIHPEIANVSSLFEKETYPTLDLQMAAVSANFDSSDFGDFVRFPALPRRSIDSRRNDAGRERSLTKRHLDHCICQKESVYVTFEELGLGDVVLAPNGFNWTVCSRQPSIPFDDKSSDKSSDKPHNSLFMHHMSTAWKLLMKKYGHRKELDCVETGWKPLQVLYLDDEHAVQYQWFENFLPTSCTCTIC